MTEEERYDYQKLLLMRSSFKIFAQDNIGFKDNLKNLKNIIASLKLVDEEWKSTINANLDTCQRVLNIKFPLEAGQNIDKELAEFDEAYPSITRLIEQELKKYRGLEVKEEVLEWLQFWYQSQCDGDWEHSSVVSVELADNLGWNILIRIDQTECDDLIFSPINFKISEDVWVDCKVEDNYFRHFKAQGGGRSLGLIFTIFKDWATQTPIDISANRIEEIKNSNELIKCLENWRLCHSITEEQKKLSFRFNTVSNPGWSLKLSLENKKKSNPLILSEDIERSAFDWVFCNITSDAFASGGGPFNLTEMFTYFKKQAKCNTKFK